MSLCISFCHGRKAIMFRAVIVQRIKSMITFGVIFNKREFRNCVKEVIESMEKVLKRFPQLKERSSDIL